MKLRFIYILVLAFIMSACDKGSDYRNAIPSRSAAVVAVDLNSMSEKMGLSGEKLTNLFLTSWKIWLRAD